MISLENVSKSFRNLKVLNSLSCEFPATGISFLMAPNGSGKTTLIRCILGLETYSGKITVDDHPVDVSERAIYPVFDDDAFYNRLTGLQNLHLLLGKKPEGFKFSYLDEKILKSRVRNYSRGQRKRLGLMAALNSGAQMIILDEPTNGLDLDTMRALRDDLLALKSSTSFLITGHQFDYYDELIDTFFVLRDGAVHTTSLPSRARPKERSTLEIAYDENFATDEN